MGVLAPHLAVAQLSPRPMYRMPNQTVYIEVGGNAGYISLNNDRKLNESFTLRAATGKSYGYNFGDQPSRLARLHALTVNFLLHDSPSTPHWFELGLGVVAGEQWRDVIDYEDRKNVLSATGTVGYRWMDDHWILRAGVAPYHGFRGDYPFHKTGYRLGASFGVAF
jgi:hypothetical protein